MALGRERERGEGGGGGGARRRLFRIVHARGEIPNEMGPTHCRVTLTWTSQPTRSAPRHGVVIFSGNDPANMSNSARGSSVGRAPTQMGWGEPDRRACLNKGKHGQEEATKVVTYGSC